MWANEPTKPIHEMEEGRGRIPNHSYVKFVHPFPSESHHQIRSTTAPNRINEPGGEFRLPRFSLVESIFPRGTKPVASSNMDETTFSTHSTLRDVVSNVDKLHDDDNDDLWSTSRSETEIVPVSEVRLDDLLQGRLGSPFSVRDFESYLVYKALASELLYFEVWLEAYTSLYNACPRAERTQSLLLALRASYEHAMATFFSNSPLELNLPDSIKREVFAEASALSRTLSITPAAEPFLPPSALLPSRKEVHSLLNDSFRAFVALQIATMHVGRPWLTWVFGAAMMIVAIVPVVVLVQLRMDRALRLVGAPFIFIGVVFLFSAPRKVCPVLYVLKPNRMPSKKTSPEDLSAPAPSFILHLPEGGQAKQDFSSSVLCQLRFYPLPPPIITPLEGNFSHLEIIPTQDLRREEVRSVDLTSVGEDKDRITLSTIGQVVEVAPRQPAGGSRGWTKESQTRPSPKGWEVDSSRKTIIYAVKWAAFLTIIASGIAFSIPNKHQ